MRHDLLSLIVAMCARRDDRAFSINDYLSILQATDHQSPSVGDLCQPRLPIGPSRERLQRKDIAVHALRMSAAALRRVAQRGRSGIESYLAKGTAPYGALVDRVVKGYAGITRKRRRRLVKMAPMIVDAQAVAMPAWEIKERRNTSQNADHLEHARACYHERFSICRDRLRSERTGHGRRRDRTVRYAQDVQLSEHAQIVAAGGIEHAILAHGGWVAALSASWRGPIGGYRDPLVHIPIGYPPGARPTAADTRVLAIRLMLHLGIDPDEHAFVVVQHSDKVESCDRIDAHLLISRTRRDGLVWGLPSHWHTPTCQLAAWLVADECGLGAASRTDVVVRSEPWDVKMRASWQRGRESGPHGRAIAARLLSRDPGVRRRDVTLLDARAMRRVAVGLGSATVAPDAAVFVAKVAPTIHIEDIEAYLRKAGHSATASR